MNSYESQTQKKNLAWFLPRPKSDKYKGGMPLYCEEWLIQLGEDILKQNNNWRSNIYILNLFCGMNKQGFRIDINPEVNPDICADAHTFAENWNCDLFDLIIADPPYSDKESKELYNTGKLNYAKWTGQCEKVLRPNGLLIIYHKFVVPNPNPHKFEVIKRVFIGNRIWHSPRVAIFFQKKVAYLPYVKKMEVEK